MEGGRILYVQVEPGDFRPVDTRVNHVGPLQAGHDAIIVPGAPAWERPRAR